MRPQYLPPTPQPEQVAGTQAKGLQTTRWDTNKVTKNVEFAGTKELELLTPCWYTCDVTNHLIGETFCDLLSTCDHFDQSPVT